MDFFGFQDQAQRSTRKLVFLFFIAIAAIIIVLYIATVQLFIPPHGFEGPPEQHLLKFFTKLNLNPPPGMTLEQWLIDRDWWYPKLFLGLAVIITALILGGTLYKTSQLNKGGQTIATMLGGRIILPDIADADERRLLNVVEEMAIAAGTPVPAVYLLDREPGINAFAAGFSQKDTVLGITRGCLALLSRDELQGVIAHEFSHILRGDMRLNMRLMGTVFGITMISMVGYFILRFTTTGFRFGIGSSGSVKKKGKGGGLGVGVLVFGALLFVLGYMGVFFGNLIKSAIARQREFLADASAVQFTRNPSGLAGALKKIGGLAQGSRILSPHAHEASHFYFSNGIRNGFFGFLATHPPIAKRIIRLDPSFTGNYPEIQLPEIQAPAKAEPDPHPSMAGKSTASTEPIIPVVPPRQFVASIGMLTADQIDYAAGLRKKLPEALQEAVREPVGASAIVLSLLLSGKNSIRTSQMEMLREESAPAVFKEIENLYPCVQSLKPAMRIPLVDWAMPALRSFSDKQYANFRALTERLISADRQIDLFEYSIQRMLRRRLDAYFHNEQQPSVKYKKTEDILPEALYLLSALAWTGHASETGAFEAFLAGAHQLNLSRQRDFTLEPDSKQVDLQQLDKKLEMLSLAGPYVRKNLLFACAHTVASDGRILEPERELLRAVADSFDLPVPPFVREIMQQSDKTGMRQVPGT